MTPQRTTLKVSFTPELSDFIALLVQSGKYKPVSEVVREGLRLLQQQASSLVPVNKKHQMSAVEEKGHQ